MDAKKKPYKKNVLVLKPYDSAARFPRSQAAFVRIGCQRQPTKDKRDTSYISPYRMTAQNVHTVFNVIAQRHDDSDDSSTFIEVAKMAGFYYTGKLNAIETVRLKVAMNWNKNAKFKRAVSNALSLAV